MSINSETKVVVFYLNVNICCNNTMLCVKEIEEAVNKGEIQFRLLLLYLSYLLIFWFLEKTSQV